MGEHPTPWVVKYWRRCPNWAERSCPQIMDANGDLVCEVPQTVSHPGIYDALADAIAKRIVEAVNAGLVCPAS